LRRAGKPADVPHLEERGDPTIAEGELPVDVEPAGASFGNGRRAAG
jgi:hypothetical protein